MIALSEALKARAANVRLLALDVDGVLTDGRLIYGSQGEELKVFHARDGLGLRMVMDIGIEVALITARRSEALLARVRDLRIAHHMPGRDDKLAAFSELRQRLGLDADQCAFVGDDVLDLPVLRNVGLPICVADAHPLARQAALFVTEARGGHGAVREVTDILLESRVGLMQATEAFLATKLGRGALEQT